MAGGAFLHYAATLLRATLMEEIRSAGSRRRELSALMGYEDGNWGAGQWFVMGTMMLIFWGLVIGLVIWAVRGHRDGAPFTHTKHMADCPDALLAERYARGEIGEDEYLRRRKLLHKAPPSPSGSKRAP